MIAKLHLPRGARFYQDAIEGLVRVNADLYRESPRLPSIYDVKAGVRYRAERGTEEWRHVGEVLRERFGDCEDLAAARAGELRARGEPDAYAIVTRTSPNMTHGRVVRADGTIEDPSRLLGMKSREQIGGQSDMSDYPGYDEMGAWLRPRNRKGVVQVGPRANPKGVVQVATSYVKPDDVHSPFDNYAQAEAAPLPYAGAPRPDFAFEGPEDAYGDSTYESDWEVTEDDWEQIGADPGGSSELTWSVDRTATGWRGTVHIPFGAGKLLTVSRGGETKASATASAFKAASGVLDSDLAKALIPPQAAAALKVLQSPTAQKAAKVAIDAVKKLKFW
jgi:hypothetical protein